MGSISLDPVLLIIRLEESLTSHTTAVTRTSAGGAHRAESYPSRPSTLTNLKPKLPPSAPIHARTVLHDRIPEGDTGSSSSSHLASSKTWLATSCVQTCGCGMPRATKHLTLHPAITKSEPHLSKIYLHLWFWGCCQRVGGGQASPGDRNEARQTLRRAPFRGRQSLRA